VCGKVCLCHKLSELVRTGSAIWIFGAARKDLQAPPVDHKICVSTAFGRHPECYRVDVAEIYNGVTDDTVPVPIFAKGYLPEDKHRISISIADPTHWMAAQSGITFTHAVYTVERPTPWYVIHLIHGILHKALTYAY
jgi:hypothetical protein